MYFVMGSLLLVQNVAMAAGATNDDSCAYANDGMCDDYNGWCTAGTDCTDCLNCGAVDNNNNDNDDAAIPSQLVTAMIRDFTSAHPDFKAFHGSGETGCVESELGSDDKPVLTGACAGYTTADNFAEWYAASTPAVARELEFVWDDSEGLYVYDSSIGAAMATSYFPVDGLGCDDRESLHEGRNFYFTSELVIVFEYVGGETFSFQGDDDVWVFIDRKLAVDLGGVHPPLAGSVDLDTLGLVPGTNYELRLFHAERQCCGSNFRAATSINLGEEAVCPHQCNAPTGQGVCDLGSGKCLCCPGWSGDDCGTEGGSVSLDTDDNDDRSAVVVSASADYIGDNYCYNTDVTTLGDGKSGGSGSSSGSGSSLGDNGSWRNQCRAPTTATTTTATSTSTSTATAEPRTCVYGSFLPALVGVAGDGLRFHRENGHTRETCANLCRATSQCLAFGFRNNRKKPCELWAHGNTQAAEKWEYYVLYNHCVTPSTITSVTSTSTTTTESITTATASVTQSSTTATKTSTTVTVTSSTNTDTSTTATVTSTTATESSTTVTRSSTTVTKTSTTVTVTSSTNTDTSTTATVTSTTATESSTTATGTNTATSTTATGTSNTGTATSNTRTSTTESLTSTSSRTETTTTNPRNTLCIGTHCGDVDGIVWDWESNGAIDPVPETAEVGRLVTTIPGPTLDGYALPSTFSFVGQRQRRDTDQFPFAVDRVSGEMTVTGALDFETDSSYNLAIAISATFFYKIVELHIPIAPVACANGTWSLTGTHPCTATTATVTTITTTSSDTTSAGLISRNNVEIGNKQSGQEKNNEGSSSGVIIGILVAAIACMVIVAALVMKRKRDVEEREVAEKAAALAQSSGFALTAAGKTTAVGTKANAGGEYAAISGCEQSSNHAIYQMATDGAEEATYEMATESQAESTYEMAHAHLAESVYHIAGGAEDDNLPGAVYDAASEVDTKENTYCTAAAVEVQANRADADEDELYSMATDVDVASGLGPNHDDDELYAIADAVGAGVVAYGGLRGEALDPVYAMGNAAADIEAIYALGSQDTLEKLGTIEKGSMMDAIYAMGDAPQLEYDVAAEADTVSQCDSHRSSVIMDAELISAVRGADEPLYTLGDEPAAIEHRSLRGDTIGPVVNLAEDEHIAVKQLASLRPSDGADFIVEDDAEALTHLPRELRSSSTLPPFHIPVKSHSLRGTPTPAVERDVAHGVATAAAQDDYLGVGSDATLSLRKGRSDSHFFEPNGFVVDRSRQSLRLISVRRTNPVFGKEGFMDVPADPSEEDIDVDETYIATAKSV